MSLDERDVSSAFRLLPAGYAALFGRLREACLRDDRVGAMWLGGSMARGEEDQSSDLDVFLAVSDAGFDEFASEWRIWLGAITPTVIARQLPFARGALYCVTPGMERLDIVSEPISALATSFHRVRRLVFDKDGVDELLPPPFPVAGPSTDVIAGHIEEFFRDYAMFHTVVDRQDWLLGLEAIHTIRTLLYRLFVESNAPLAASGVKRWSSKLTIEQRALLESLPSARANHDEVVDVHETVARAFKKSAMEIARQLGIVWPSELENSVCESLQARGLPSLQ